MHSRTHDRTRWTVRLALGLALLLAPLVSLGLAPHVATAQVRIPAEALADDAHLQQLLQRGQELEQGARWGEALSHYEQALREYPDRGDLRQRFVLARTHFDVSRRYHDRSFTGMLGSVTEAEALDLYGDVLLKINTHSAYSPDWAELGRRGQYTLEVALSDPEFAKSHLAEVDSERLNTLLDHLRTTIAEFPPKSRADCRDLAAWSARTAWQTAGIAPQAVLLEFTCGAVASLDEYSSYLTRDQLAEVYSQIDGNFVGLGIELKSEEGRLGVVNVLGDSPAHRAGLRAGDWITAVDGRSTADVSTDAAADLLKGPEGTYVDIVVASADGSERQLRLERQRVEVPSVEGVKMLDPDSGVGYFQITSFQKNTSRDVDAALWQLHRAGMRSLVIDVRGNPGGLLTASVEVADKFITGGTIVSTRGRSTQEDYDYKAHEVGTWRLPLIVLIDGDSASAAEIFAAAIRDSRAGTVVGQQSYGKGTVQGIFPLGKSGCGVRLTTAKFYSPSGTPISHRGVSPDLAVRKVARVTSEGQTIDQQGDDVLSAALQMARQQARRP